jgi:EmrB/QacA subfamily drug resistance transporter
MGTPAGGGGTPRLAILLAAAMFVFVIDTSFMNVSISAVVHDLDTTVSAVQAAVTTEALVSASFILISSKIGDLFGRKRAYVVGLLFYAAGALAMVVAQSVWAIIVFWAVIGGLGASLYLPAMQSLIHGNFEGKMRAKVYALVGAAGAIAAAVGPLIGGFVTTALSWRVGFLVEALIIAVVLFGTRLIRDVPYTGDRSVDYVGSFLSVVGMAGLVVGVLVWQAGGEWVGALLAVGAAAFAGLAYWLIRRKREGKPTLIDPTLFTSKLFSVGVFQIFLQQLALGGLLIVLPIYLQLVLGYNALEAGLTLAPLSLTMFGVALLAGRRAGRRRPSSIVRAGFVLLAASIVILIPLVPKVSSGWYLAIPLVLTGSGLGLVVSQLNNYALSPISEERVGEAAGVTSATGSFGLSFGLAVTGAVMLASLSIAFTHMSNASDVLPPADKQQIANVLEDDAQVMSDAQLQDQLAGQPQAIQDEVLSINTDARHLSLQVALLVTLLASLIGIANAFRMARLPDPKPSGAAEGMAL